MRGTKRVSRLLWRWRTNPLRRHEDVVGAWIVLAVWMVIATGGTVIGVLTAHAADESFAQLRRERHPVQAVLAESTAPTVTRGAGTPYDQVRATVRWTAKDGATRTGQALLDPGQRAGSEVVVWLNGSGRLTTEPTSASTAAVEADVFGAAAALAFASLALAAGRVVRWRFDQRLHDRWGREWEQLGPQWRRRTN
ncbi:MULTISPECIES: Rv1733c family protein [unclassified Streptomyces]|uniref:Rv1733c family protein n=1 Tax=unclassified Streptomyces TaxID=2593676 RepID=UPI0011CD4065|nr:MULTISPECIES: hypothetical protein [unclassified Streptomyces]TXS78987.1 hypothetical protein EAO69_05800 [Streptomyces sp. me109]